MVIDAVIEPDDPARRADSPLRARRGPATGSSPSGATRSRRRERRARPSLRSRPARRLCAAVPGPPLGRARGPADRDRLASPVRRGAHRSGSVALGRTRNGLDAERPRSSSCAAARRAPGVRRSPRPRRLVGEVATCGSGAIESLPWDDDGFDRRQRLQLVSVRRRAARRFPRGVLESRGPEVWSRSASGDRARRITTLAAVRRRAGARAGCRRATDDRAPRFGDPGVLEGLATDAGLTVLATGEVPVPYEFADTSTLWCGADVVRRRAPRPAGRASMRTTIRRAILEAAAPFPRPLTAPTLLEPFAG